MKTPRTPTSTVTRVWLALIMLTLITFSFGAMALDGLGLVAAVLVIALVKGQLVVDHFMGLRRGAPMWRAILAGYLLVLGALIAIAFAAAEL
jgi:cytochrome c oxidase subunit IV